MKGVFFHRTSKTFALLLATTILLTGCNGGSKKQNSTASGAISNNDVISDKQISDIQSSSLNSSLNGGSSLQMSSVNNSSKTNTSAISNLPTVTIKLSDFQDGSNTRSDTALITSALSKAKQTELQAKNEGKKVNITIKFDKKEYRIQKTIQIPAFSDLTIDGNGATIIMEADVSIFKIMNCSNLNLINLSLDYDPLPFTQGTITKIEGFNGSVVYLKPDKGYPDKASMLNKYEIYTVHMDRARKSFVDGYRTTVSVKNIEDAGNGVLKLNMNLPINERWDCQTEVKVGDTLIVRTSGVGAIDISNSSGTVFRNFNIYSSRGMGIYEFGGECGTKMINLKVIPGPKPAGATEDRLISTNFDGTHFIAVKNGVTMDGCTFKACMDDPLNIHNFYYLVLEKTGSNKYLVSPKWDVGLEKDDEIALIDKQNFVTKGKAKVSSLTKEKMPERKAEVNQLWSGKSAPVDSTLLYEITITGNVTLNKGDSVTSLTRLGNNTVVKNSKFDSCGRICVKGSDSIIENNEFSNTSGPAIYIGSDIGFWAESHFTNNIKIRNNTFRNCGLGGNYLAGSDVLGTITVSLVAPLNSRGFYNNMENKNILIENNKIYSSNFYGIFVTNADGVKIKNNHVENSFKKGLFSSAGDHYFIRPNSGIFIGMSKNIECSGNTHVKNQYTPNAITIDPSCK